MSAGPSLRLRGASLVEVLVALLVLSVGLLGMAALQGRALRGGLGSFQRTQAVVLAGSMLDALRIDRAAARQGDYNTGQDPACDAAAYPGTTRVQRQMREWITAAQAGLGRGSGAATCVTVACDALNLCRVEIQWDDRPGQGRSAERLGLSTRL